MPQMDPQVEAWLEVEAAAVSLLGLVAYCDHYWNDQWSSSIGHSSTEVENESLQEPDASRRANTRP